MTVLHSAEPLTAPGPKPSETAAVLEALQADTLAQHVRLFEQYGDVVRLQAGPFVSHFLFHPEAVKHVLQVASRNYSKNTYGGRRAHAILGDGLFLSEGERWTRQRRLTQSAFVSRDHARVAQISAAAGAAALESWAQASARGETLELGEELLDLTFLIIGRVLLNSKLEAGEWAKLRLPFDTASREATSVKHLGARQALQNDPAAEDFRTMVAAVHSTVMRFVAERRDRPEQDFLTRLISAGADADEGFDDDELRDQVKTLLYAGHETNARTLEFALYCASQNPQMMETLRDEARTLGSGGPLPEALARLHFTEAFVKEVLRLYSPVWSLERRALAEDCVQGYPIPAGSSVVLSQVVTHRHPGFWDAPLEFKPERFLDPEVPRHRLAYFPFGGGARLCVGNNMALLQLKLMLALILKDFRVEVPADFSPGMAVALVLRFASPLRVRFQRW